MENLASINTVQDKAQRDDHMYKHVMPSDTQQTKSNSQNNLSKNPLLLAYYYILQSVLTNQATARVQQSQIQNNANAQNKLINSEQQQQFETLNHSLVFTKDYHEYIKSGRTWDGGPTAWSQHTGWVTAGHKIPYGRASSAWDQPKYLSWRVLSSKWITKKVSSMKLGSLNMKNAEVSANRNVIEDRLNLLSQGAQISETQMNANMDINNQYVQESSGIMQMLLSVTQQIAKI